MDSAQRWTPSTGYTSSPGPVESNASWQGHYKPVEQAAPAEMPVPQHPPAELPASNH